MSFDVDPSWRIKMFGFKVRVFDRDDQIVSAIIVAVFLMIAGFYFWQRSVTNGGLIDFEDLPSKHAVYLVDVNNAGWTELSNLPGIGEKLAKQIVTHRQQFGPFVSKEQLQEVAGIGQSKLSAMLPHIFVSVQKRGESNGN